MSARLLKENQVRKITEGIKYLITSSDARLRKRQRTKTEDYHGEEELINKENEYEDLIVAHVPDHFSCISYVLFGSCFLHKQHQIFICT